MGHNFSADRKCPCPLWLLSDGASPTTSALETARHPATLSPRSNRSNTRPQWPAARVSDSKDTVAEGRSAAKGDDARTGHWWARTWFEWLRL